VKLERLTGSIDKFHNVASNAAYQQISVAYVFISFLNCHPFYTWSFFFVKAACQETMVRVPLINHGLDHTAAILRLGPGADQNFHSNFPIGNEARKRTRLLSLIHFPGWKHLTLPTPV
jgi:hypothetical protein